MVAIPSSGTDWGARIQLRWEGTSRGSQVKLQTPMGVAICGQDIDATRLKRPGQDAQGENRRYGRDTNSEMTVVGIMGSEDRR